MFDALKVATLTSAYGLTKSLINKYEAIAKKPVKVYGDKRSNYISFD